MDEQMGDCRILLLTDLNEDELNIIKQQIYNIKYLIRLDSMTVFIMIVLFN